MGNNDIIGFPVFGWKDIPQSEVFSKLEKYNTVLTFESMETISELVWNNIESRTKSEFGQENELKRGRLFVVFQDEIIIQGVNFTPVGVVIISSPKTSIYIGFGVNSGEYEVDQEKLKYCLADLLKEDDQLFLITKMGEKIECYGNMKSAEEYLAHRGHDFPK